MNYKKLTNGFVRGRVKDEFLKSETVQETVANLKGMCPNYDEIIENNYSGEKSYIPTLGEVVREARAGDTVAQRCLAEIKRCGNISDSRRVKDEEEQRVYSCNSYVQMDDDGDGDVFVSKSTGETYGYEEFNDDSEVNRFGDFFTTWNDAFDVGMGFCYDFAEKFPNDPYIVNVSTYIKHGVDDYEEIETETFNAWYNEYTGKINWV